MLVHIGIHAHDIHVWYEHARGVRTGYTWTHTLHIAYTLQHVGIHVVMHPVGLFGVGARR